MEVNKDKEIEERNRFIDYIFDNDKVEEHADKISLEDAIRYIQMNLKRDKKDIHPMNCPVCERPIGIETKSLNGGELHFLLALYAMQKKEAQKRNIKMFRIEQFDEFYFEDVYETINRILKTEKQPREMQIRPSSYSRLRFWGLIERGEKKGYWKINKFSLYFLANKIAIPEKIFISCGKKIGESDNKLFFNQCEKEKWEDLQKYRTTDYFNKF